MGSAKEIKLNKSREHRHNISKLGQDGVMTWERFPHYWPFVRGIHWCPLMKGVCQHGHPIIKWAVRRADSRFAPSQWETALLCNDVSHWLGANLETAPSSDLTKYLGTNNKHRNNGCRDLVPHCAWRFSHVHWNENFVILTIFSPLAALKFAKMATFSTASDGNFIKMMTFPFRHMGCFSDRRCSEKLVTSQ